MIIRAFDEHLATFHQVQHVHTSTRVVRYRPGEPMTTGLDEFSLVKAGTFFVPAVALCHSLRAIDELPFYPIRGSFPLDIPDPMIEVDRTRTAV